MAFFDKRFPESISEGATGGPMWSTSVATTISGIRSTNRNWSMPLHRYDVAHALKRSDRLELLKSFFYVVGGRADSFRYKDWLDFTATQENSSLTLISGSDYQLNRVYTAYTRTFTRQITKPVSATVIVYRTRAAVTSVATATIDYTTGIATISGHAGGDTYTWEGQFDVPCSFVSDQAQFRLIAAGEIRAAWPQIAIEEVRIP